MRQIFIPIAAAAALAACSAPPLALAADPAPRTLVVSGTGEASGKPDLATLSVGVQTQGATAAAALAANAARMSATIAKLKAHGIAEKDMQTRNISVNPRYDYESNRSSPKITGYVANNTLSVKLRDISKVGEVIDDAVSDGANSLGGLSFGFADPKPLTNEARVAAIGDAKAKAALYANAAGVTLGPILQIQDGYAAVPHPQPYMDMRVAAAEASTTPISAGESTLSANVTLVYEIQ